MYASGLQYIRVFSVSLFLSFTLTRSSVSVIVRVSCAVNLAPVALLCNVT